MTGRVVVIGAGMAGLACARRLAAAGHAPLIFDKGRGIGGRLATRRVGPDGGAGALQFDHGAQYLTARDPGFAALIEAMAGAGAAARWSDGSGRTRWVGRPGMSGLPRAMAAGLEVRQGVQVTALRPDGPGWRIEAAAETLSAARVVVTVPAPQLGPLIGAAHPLAAGAAAATLLPCLTLMAGFPADAPRPFAAAASDSDPLSWIAQDSTKPGRPDGATAWVAQAGPDWSAAHLEETPERLTDLMLPLLARRLGVSPGAAVHAAVHRWRHARVAQPLGRPFLAAGGLWAGGDWCLGARVEAAWQSGTAIAEDILESGHAR